MNPSLSPADPEARRRRARARAALARLAGDLVARSVARCGTVESAYVHVQTSVDAATQEFAVVVTDNGESLSPELDVADVLSPRWADVPGARAFVRSAGRRAPRSVEFELSHRGMEPRAVLRPQSGGVESETTVGVAASLTGLGDVAAIRGAVNAALWPLGALGCPARIEIRHADAASAGFKRAPAPLPPVSCISPGWRQRLPEALPELRCNLLARALPRLWRGRARSHGDPPRGPLAWAAWTDDRAGRVRRPRGAEALVFAGLLIDPLRRSGSLELVTFRNWRLAPEDARPLCKALRRISWSDYGLDPPRAASPATEASSERPLWPGGSSLVVHVLEEDRDPTQGVHSAVLVEAVSRTLERAQSARGDLFASKSRRHATFALPFVASALVRLVEDPAEGSTERAMAPEGFESGRQASVARILGVAPGDVPATIGRALEEALDHAAESESAQDGKPSQGAPERRGWEALAPEE